MKLLKSACLIAVICITACHTPAPVVGQAPPPEITKDGSGRPNWVNRPADAYNPSLYKSAVGSGPNREMADARAFGEMVSIFGQKISDNLSIVETYKEKVSSGSVSVQNSVASEEAISRSASMNQLIGAEIGDRWQDTRTKTFYAVAVMQIPQARQLYTDMIDSNLQLIEKSLNIPSADRASFDAIARYQLAATLADTNGVFANVLSVLGAPYRKAELKSGEEYRFEASNVAKTIPVNVTVTGDDNNRIKNAFSSALTGKGFRPGNNNSRFVINVTVSLKPVTFPGNNNKFTTWVVDAQLTDKTSGQVLIPYNINGREGHASQDNADRFAINAAEKKVKEDYLEVLTEYLESAL
ncbi:hypothetical protein AGMMS49928_19730 [Spirochaetia bacterium]|nr:hypothetical protein AGMMS49928_19730 [Spirochaetia bacterium]